MKELVGVLVMAYGSAKDFDQIEAYYTHIRHGRPPSPEQLADLTFRYRAIGGVSPLFEITRRQAERLEQTLNKKEGPYRFRIYLGMKHSRPFISDGIEQLMQDGVSKVIGLVLAPHYSSMSVGAYIHQAQDALSEFGDLVEFLPITSWHLFPAFIRLLGQRVEIASRTLFTDKEQERLPVVFTAHSLPERIVALKDPYPNQVRETGEAVARLLKWPLYTFSWQSAGRTSEPWMQPDILDKMAELARSGERQALICPVGFVSDHLEVLYDLDIQAQEHARQLGMHIERTPSFNDDPDFIDMLSDVVRHRLGESE